MQSSPAPSCTDSRLQISFLLSNIEDTPYVSESSFPVTQQSPQCYTNLHFPLTAAEDEHCNSTDKQKNVLKGKDATKGECDLITHPSSLFPGVARIPMKKHSVSSLSQQPNEESLNEWLYSLRAQTYCTTLTSEPEADDDKKFKCRFSESCKKKIKGKGNLRRHIEWYHFFYL
jgi:hypothetical protein